MERFDQTGEVYNRGQVLFNMALVYKDMGDLNRARTLFDVALDIFQDLDALPCVASAKLNLGIISGQMGRSDEAIELFSQSIGILEGLGALPDLCEGYIAAALFNIQEGHSMQSRFYLSQAETQVSRTDYPPLKIQLYRAQGERFLKDMLYPEAKSCFEKALALSRKLSLSYEEAKAISSLGRLALASGDYEDALRRMKQALVIFGRLGASLDLIEVYRDMTLLFLAQDDYQRAEEMAMLRQRQARILGHADLSLLATVDLAECEARTGKKEEARADYAGALRLAGKEGDRIPSSTIRQISEKAIEFLEAEASQPEEGRQASLLRERLGEEDYEKLLEELPHKLECRRIG